MDESPRSSARNIQESLFGWISGLHPWLSTVKLSSALERVNRILEDGKFDRGPWISVVLGAGIVTWFALKTPVGWGISMFTAAAFGAGAIGMMYRGTKHHELFRSLAVIGFVFAFGIALIWARSAMVGVQPADRPQVLQISGRVLDREEQPARAQVRLILAMRDANSMEAHKIRINVPMENDNANAVEGAIVHVNARLMPPAPPILPGAYDFARKAWFEGLWASGTAVGDVEIVQKSAAEDGIARAQRFLSAHVRGEVGGSAGAIAAAFASGDRGGISAADEDAMRDAGLTHLLSISGLHVSAVIAAAYVLFLRIFAAIPFIALRVRLPLAAGLCGAGAGVAYTLLTGAEVPTVRSCLGAILVLIAVAIGREPMSMRMLSAAAFIVLLFAPESLVNVSFQLSFSAVLAIIAFHSSAPVQAFLQPREERLWITLLRKNAVVFATGLVIELALMPIVLFHFHRAGLYGAMANVLAIPLVTLVTMPLIAISLLLDLVGMGAVSWWLAEQSLNVMLFIAHFFANLPGAITLVPNVNGAMLALWAIGGLWIGLVRGRIRLWGLVPWGLSAAMLAVTPVADVFVSGDGRHVIIREGDDKLYSLRNIESGYTRDNFSEITGIDTDVMSITRWDAARCNDDYCFVDMQRGERNWKILLARSVYYSDYGALIRACAASDIVIAARRLPRRCSPKWRKIDRRLLAQTGGLTINLADRDIDTVAERQGGHGWWKGRTPAASN